MNLETFGDRRFLDCILSASFLPERYVIRRVRNPCHGWDHSKPFYRFVWNFVPHLPTEDVSTHLKAFSNVRHLGENSSRRGSKLTQGTASGSLKTRWDRPGVQPVDLELFFFQWLAKMSNKLEFPTNFSEFPIAVMNRRVQWPLQRRSLQAQFHYQKVSFTCQKQIGMIISWNNVFHQDFFGVSRWLPLKSATISLCFNMFERMPRVSHV